MKMKVEKFAVRCLIAFFSLAAVCSGLALQSYIIKRDAARLLFENLTFTRISVEARQHIRKIEYGIKNGRELEQFYNMNDILRDIQRSSSYISGVYIVGGGDSLLYSIRRNPEQNLSLRRPRATESGTERVYRMIENPESFDLFLPIRDPDGLDTAYAIIRLDKDAVYFSTLELTRQEFVQGAIITAQILGLGLIVIIKKKPKAGGIALMIFLMALAGLTTDAGLSFSRYRGIVESTTVQSVNRITQLLQNDVEIIRAMGVEPNVIRDQNSWLQQAARGIPMIHSMSMNYNMRITPTVSDEYINQYSSDLLKSFIAVYIVLFLTGAAVFAFIRIRKKKRRSSE